MALNPTNKTDYIIQYRNGSMAYSVERCMPNEHFESWLVKNTELEFGASKD